MKTDRVLPFRFLAAARYAPQWEEILERAMFRALADKPRLTGHTVLMVDVSGSMVAPLSRRSEMLRTDAAYGLAVLLRELAEKVTIYTFSTAAKQVPARRGFALRDAMEASQPHGATNLGASLDAVNEHYDRIIVITDEQSHDRVPRPASSRLHHQRSQLQERSRIRPLEPHRRLERVHHRLHPRAGAIHLALTQHTGTP